MSSVVEDCKGSNATEVDGSIATSPLSPLRCDVLSRVCTHHDVCYTVHVDVPPTQQKAFASGAAAVVFDSSSPSPKKNPNTPPVAVAEECLSRELARARRWLASMAGDDDEDGSEEGSSAFSAFDAEYFDFLLVLEAEAEAEAETTRGGGGDAIASVGDTVLSRMEGAVWDRLAAFAKRVIADASELIVFDDSADRRRRYESIVGLLEIAEGAMLSSSSSSSLPSSGSVGGGGGGSSGKTSYFASSSAAASLSGPDSAAARQRRSAEALAILASTRRNGGIGEGATADANGPNSVAVGSGNVSGLPHPHPPAAANQFPLFPTIARADRFGIGGGGVVCAAPTAGLVVGGRRIPSAASSFTLPLNSHLQPAPLSCFTAESVTAQLKTVFNNRLIRAAERAVGGGGGGGGGAVGGRAVGGASPVVASPLPRPLTPLSGNGATATTISSNNTTTCIVSSNSSNNSVSLFAANLKADVLETNYTYACSAGPSASSSSVSPSSAVPTTASASVTSPSPSPLMQTPPASSTASAAASALPFSHPHVYSLLSTFCDAYASTSAPAAGSGSAVVVGESGGKQKSAESGGLATADKASIGGGGPLNLFPLSLPSSFPAVGRLRSTAVGASDAEEGVASLFLGFLRATSEAIALGRPSAPLKIEEDIPSIIAVSADPQRCEPTAVAPSTAPFPLLCSPITSPPPQSVREALHFLRLIAELQRRAPQFFGAPPLYVSAGLNDYYRRCCEAGAGAVGGCKKKRGLGAGAGAARQLWLHGSSDGEPAVALPLLAIVLACAGPGEGVDGDRPEEWCPSAPRPRQAIFLYTPSGSKHWGGLGTSTPSTNNTNTNNANPSATNNTATATAAFGTTTNGASAGGAAASGSQVAIIVTHYGSQLLPAVGAARPPYSATNSPIHQSSARGASAVIADSVHFRTPFALPVTVTLCSTEHYYVTRGAGASPLPPTASSTATAGTAAGAARRPPPLRQIRSACHPIPLPRTIAEALVAMALGKGEEEGKTVERRDSAAAAVDAAAVAAEIRPKTPSPSLPLPTAEAPKSNSSATATAAAVASLEQVPAAAVAAAADDDTKPSATTSMPAVDPSPSEPNGGAAPKGVEGAKNEKVDACSDPAVSNESKEAVSPPQQQQQHQHHQPQWGDASAPPAAALAVAATGAEAAAPFVPITSGAEATAHQKTATATATASLSTAVGSSAPFASIASSSSLVQSASRLWGWASGKNREGTASASVGATAAPPRLSSPAPAATAATAAVMSTSSSAAASPPPANAVRQPAAAPAFLGTGHGGGIPNITDPFAAAVGARNAAQQLARRIANAGSISSFSSPPFSSADGSENPSFASLFASLPPDELADSIVGAVTVKMAEMQTACRTAARMM